MPPNGMITRHFELDSGWKCAMEMPAGWSRNCYYQITTTNPSGVQEKPTRYEFNSPDEARAAAVARERQALANGWKPRMAAVASSPRDEWNIFRPSGEKINVGLRSVEQVIEPRWVPIQENIFDRNAPTAYRQRMVTNEKSFNITAVLLEWVRTGQQDIQPGDRILLQHRFISGEELYAAIVARLRLLTEHGSAPVIEFSANMTALEDGEQEAIERWSDREAIIQAGVETDTSLVELWEWLGTRIEATTERQQVQAAIIRGRAERQARLQREQELRDMQDRQREEREMQNARDIVRMQEEARRNGYQQPLRQKPTREQQTDEALRRLSGGVDLNKPKKRKIDLGE